MLKREVGKLFGGERLLYEGKIITEVDSRPLIASSFSLPHVDH